MALTIEQARVTDFHEVKELYRRIIDGFAGTECSPGWVLDVYPDDALFQGFLERNEFFVAYVDGNPAAAMTVNRSCSDGYEQLEWPTNAAPDEVSVVHLLGVDPAFQGQGLAKKLVSFAADFARDRGDKALRLDALAENGPACMLYKRCGFAEIGTVPLFYEDTGLVDYVLYEMAL